MASHEADLRAEVQDDTKVKTLQKDYRQLALDAATRAMLDFAVKTTTTPDRMCATDVQRLREAGFRDEDIVDIAQLAAYFNYSNRLMDSLGIEPDPGMDYSESATT
ncbi:MAG TPA: peroxidase-related enzyme [Phycisphaerae bacterium]|nr:peroxidase-related enzyme [Phycisphaerae bacterium]